MRFTGIAAAATVSLAVAWPAGAEIETVDPASIGLDPAKLEDIRTALKKDVDDGRVPGAVMLIARNGKVGFVEAVGQLGPNDTKPMATDTIFRIYSMTKPIVSVAAMMLVEDGRLVLDEPISTYIPQFAAMQVSTPAEETSGNAEDDIRPAANEITVRDLLRHTSGLIYGVFDKGKLGEMYKEAEIAGSDFDLDELSRRLSALPLRLDPGTGWHYSRSTDVLGHVIERASGQKLDAFLKEKIFDPLGMKDTAFYHDLDKAGRIAQPVKPLFRVTEPKPMLSGGGGLTSTLEDYLRFVMMLRNRGSLDGEQIILPTTLAAMTSNQIEGLDRSFFYPGDAYGFGLGFAVRLTEDGPYPGTIGDYWWRGLAGTYFWVDPRKDLFAIFMIQDPDNRVHYTGQTRNWVYEALAE